MLIVVMILILFSIYLFPNRSRVQETLPCSAVSDDGSECCSKHFGSLPALPGRLDLNYEVGHEMTSRAQREGGL